MNTLAWLIYFTQIVGTLRVVSFIFIAVILPILTVLKLIGAFEDTEAMWTKNGKEFVKVDRLPISLKQIVVSWSVLVLLIVVVPSRETIMLVASSVYAEKILNNPKVNEIIDPSLDLLKTWIEKEKEQLTEKGK